MSDSRPLHGLRVLAVEQFGAGPWATMQLADLGADVIKVEDPRSKGDVGRYVPPHQSDDTSLFFEAFNRGKRSITLDLRLAGARPVLEDLVRESDCVFGNLRGSSFVRLRLRYRDLAHVNSRIVCCCLSGFGMSGPRAGEGAYDHVVQALSGWMSLTGEPDNPPLRSGVSLADFSAGYAAAAAILAGVLQARTTGQGCDCDLALYEVALAQLNYMATWFLSRGDKPVRQTRSAHPSITPFQVYPAADGWLVVAAPKQNLWFAFVGAIDMSELGRDPRFLDFAQRLEHRAELNHLIEARLGTQPVAVWIERLNAAGVPCAPINTVEQAFADPQVAARQVIQRTSHPRLGEVGHVASALRLQEPLASPPLPAPELGEHTDEVLGELCGYDPSRIAHLRRAGVLGHGHA